MPHPPLDSFTKAMLAEYQFAGLDAAVVFIPTGQKPTPELQKIFDHADQCRWYPVLGGHQAKIPWYAAKGHEDLFQKEANGWDHQHCDFCKATINTGDHFWSADVPPTFYIFCKACRDKLKEP